MQGKRIVLVEDDENLAPILREFLAGEGYAVDVAGNADEALAAIRGTPTDLVILDVMLPGLDGFDLCQMIKDDPERRDVPVLFLTALDDGISRLTAQYSGGTSYLAKPFQRQDLLDRVRQLVDA